MKNLIYKKLGKDITFFFIISTISLATIIWIIQAVNFLDLISEDGHSLKVYFFYTLYSLPKIISRILPFIFMISLFYTLLRYDLNNELVIYWMTGISRMNLINFIIKLSFLYCLIQLIFTSIIVPESLDKGRSYFRSSNVDLFTYIIKKKKFIDSVENLKIFVEKKNENSLEKILIKEKLNGKESQIIIARKGIIADRKNFKNLILYDGKIINHENDKQSIIDFSEFTLDLSKYNSNTITHPKTQEMNSLNLLKCINNLKNLNTENKIKKVFFIGCNNEITSSIREEFLKRFFSPIFIILIGLSTSLIILTNKDQKNYKFKNFLIFSLSIMFIILSEISLRYSSNSLNNIFIYTITPTILFLIIYFSVLTNQIKGRN